jgi:NAD-dependent dihydropyrimidine dehydrogenase PreA subunit
MSETAYITIAQKMDESASTAPKAVDGIHFHEAFIKYLKLVYSPQETELLVHFKRPGSFVSTREVAETSGKDLKHVEQMLAAMFRRNALLGMGESYSLPPIQILVNIHNFYLENKPDDLEAARLYQEYFIKGGFYKYYETSKKGTPVLRTIPIDSGQKVLSAEEAHDFLLNFAAEEMALVPCPCRTRTEKMGERECKDKYPVASCIFLGPVALHFEMMGLGKRITRQQAIAYFDEMVKLGLVGTTDNAISGSTVICLCCECCCSQVRGRTRWNNPDAILPSNFVPQAGEDCIGCGICTDRCSLEALSVDEETNRSMVKETDKCIGCGVCTLVCPQETLKLHRYERSKPFEMARELVKTIARENRE